MKIQDFRDYGIDHFTPEEVVRTGASLADVMLHLMIHYERFRRLVDRRLTLLPGGLTTGNHASVWHSLGMAGDSAFYDGDGPVVFKSVLRAAIDSGFTGIGIYHNGAAYSMHLDLRPRDHVLWVAWKKHRETEWNFEYDFLVDPRLFAEGLVDPALLRR